MKATKSPIAACPESFENDEFNEAKADARELRIDLIGTREKYIELNPIEIKESFEIAEFDTGLNSVVTFKGKTFRNFRYANSIMSKLKIEKHSDVYIFVKGKAQSSFSLTC